MFGIEVNGVWCESCLCGNALELASEALNGALWMGSYLQGFPFSVIRKTQDSNASSYRTESSKAVETRLRGKSSGSE